MAAKKLTEAQKLGIAIAKDALKWIGRAKISRGQYIFGYAPAECVSGDMQKHNAVVRKNCQLCLLGAALVAKARLVNAVPMESFFSTEDTRGARPATAWFHECADQLDGIFGKDVCCLMEAAFERASVHCGRLYNNDTPEQYAAKEVAAVQFGNLFAAGDRGRAKAIFREIVRQNGTFDPLVALAHYEKKAEK
jgi:hypothetical protein